MARCLISDLPSRAGKNLGTFDADSPLSALDQYAVGNGYAPYSELTPASEWLFRIRTQPNEAGSALQELIETVRDFGARRVAA